MASLRVLASTFVLVGSLAVGTPAAGPRDGLLVSTSWLAQHLHDANLVLLHVGPKAEFAAGHIAGARYVELRDASVSAPDGLTLEMPPADTLRSSLEALGISTDSRIVVYYAKDWVSPSTRIIFTLDYAGLDNVALLDGGMSAWVKDGHEVSTEATPARTGTLAPLKTRPLIVDADFVRAHATAAAYDVIDGRAAVFYDGAEEGGPRDHRATGHIAGAHSVPFESVFGDDLKLKSTDELTAIFAKANVKPGDTIIGYCHIGQQATAMLFAARALGHHVLLYDGSFEDWARRGYPIENPAKK